VKEGEVFFFFEQGNSPTPMASALASLAYVAMVSSLTAWRVTSVDSRQDASSFLSRVMSGLEEPIDESGTGGAPVALEGRTFGPKRKRMKAIIQDEPVGKFRIER
jgi:hypothetical protein